MGWGFDDDEEDDASREARGGIAQMAAVRRILRRYLQSPEHHELTPRTIAHLHEAAMRDLLTTAGLFRTEDVEILGSRHVPPPHQDVPRLLRDACDSVNEYETTTNDQVMSLAAFVMWRIAWIHPFDDGNGRTARAVSYLVMCQRFGAELHGDRPVPQRIKYAPIEYARALEAADHAWTSGIVDVSRLQHLIEFCLTAQLRNDPPTLPD